MSEDGRAELEAEVSRCVICDVSLEYSVPAAVRGYCDVCKPKSCPECGCVNIKRRAHKPKTHWECDNGCFFEVA